MDMTREIINTNPREHANPLARIFFTYTTKLFVKGYKKPLDLEDLYNPLSGDRSSKLGDRLQIKWDAHLKSSKNPNLLKVLLQTFSREFIFLGLLLGTAELVLRIVQPIMLGRLLEYFSSGTSKTREEALFYAAAVVLMNGIIALLINQYMLEGCHTGIKIRASFCSVIYRKALKLSRTSLSHLVTGKVVNLLSNDVSRFEYFSFLFHHLWVGPASAIIISCVLWNQAGIAGLVGVVPILIISPLQSYTGKLSSYFRRQTAYKTDERIRLMDEIISGVQVIKMYAWEKPFGKIIERARALELKVITKLSFTRALFLTFNVFTTRIALFSSLLTIALTDQTLTAEKVFVFVCYYNVLSYNMSTMFVRAVTDTAEILVSVVRMQDFLLYDEQETMSIQNEINSEDAINLEKVTSKWDMNSNDVVLNNINLTVKHGQLLGVIGLVGCGKSSFLQTLLGELCVTGDIKVNGSLSYASQEAWVFAATIRHNILFGQKYDPKRYKKVVQACALESDFEQLPSGDLSVIGDRGTTLSGGQKARVNLARAIYREADVYLLDDPLSAVDVPVAKHIYQKCINGFLASKTRVLVTHQVYHLKDANGIIILNNGEIEMQGSFDKLASSEHFYAQVLKEEPKKLNDEDGKLPTHLITNMRTVESLPSIKSEHSISENENQEKVELDQMYELKEMQEKSSKGSVKGNLFLTYLSYGGNYCLVTIVLGLYILTQINVCMIDYIVSYWIKLEEAKSPNSHTVLKIYGGLVASVFAMAIIRSLLFYVIAMKSSKNMHHAMFVSVINSTMNFFDTNPSGRILNRFSKDISSIDEPLPKAMSDSGQILLLMVGSVVLVVIVNPYFLFPFIIIGFIFIFIRMVFLKSSKNIKRLEGITRSPVFTHLSSTLQGITTIRALKAQEILTHEFEKYQDLYTSSTYMFFTVSYAFGFALDLLTFAFTSFVTFSFVLFETNVSGGDVGLAITQAAALTGMLQWGVRQSAEAVNQLMAAERVLEYTQLPPEKQPLVPIEPSEQWPSSGKIIFINMGLRYSENKPLIIKNLNVTIEPSQKIGIVGRTGAGKSSIITALLRMALVEGTIEIDKIDTKDISLQLLRSKLSIIPQDPVLFSGTLRYNLDPFGEYPDHTLYKALEEVELKDPTNIINDLDYQVSARGSNYSVGQRQLICLARAIIRNNKILLLDEATANVDPQTDAVIQKTIREKFVDCTVLTIAHRLHTIIDSDKVLVMDFGTMIEFDHAHLLLQNTEGLFYKMVLDTGSNMMVQLQEVAKKDFEDRNKVN